MACQATARSGAAAPASRPAPRVPDGTRPNRRPWRRTCAKGADAASNCPSAESMKVAAAGNRVCSRSNRAVCSTRSVPPKSVGRTAWTCSVKRDSVASTPAATPCAASTACCPAWRPVWASSAPTRMIQTPKNRPAATARAAGHNTTDGRSLRRKPERFTVSVLVPQHWLRCGSRSEGGVIGGSSAFTSKSRCGERSRTIAGPRHPIPGARGSVRPPRSAPGSAFRR